MTEIWKDIKDYEGLYQVSNLGRVKSLDHYVKHPKGSLRLIKERILKPFLQKTGYLIVTLSKNNIKTSYNVHRLVAEAFVYNPYNKMCINHLNKNRTDNRADNLEWCTYKENNNWSNHNELVSNSLINNINKSKPILQYTLDMIFVTEYPSIMEASRQTGINNSNICQCCKGNKNYPYAGGYIWKYK